MLESKGRISFSIDCLDWIKRALDAPGISLVPLTPEIVVLSSRLPGEFHGDPADRIIIATALELGASLVTKDRKILSTANQAHLMLLRYNFHYVNLLRKN